jgi:hypothetical protein
MDEVTQKKLARLIRASVRGEGLDADDMAYIERCYCESPEKYSRIHKSVKDEEFAKINPMHAAPAKQGEQS